MPPQTQDLPPAAILIPVVEQVVEPIVDPHRSTTELVADNPLPRPNIADPMPPRISVRLFGGERLNGSNISPDANVNQLRQTSIINRSDAPARRRARAVPKQKTIPSSNRTELSAAGTAPPKAKQNAPSSNPAIPPLTPLQTEAASWYNIAVVTWPWAVSLHNQCLVQLSLISLCQLKRDIADREQNHPFKAFDLVEATSILRRLQLMKCYKALRLSKADSPEETSRKFIEGINAHLQQESISLPPRPHSEPSTMGADPMHTQQWRLGVVKLVSGAWGLSAHPRASSATFVEIIKSSRGELDINLDQTMPRRLLFISAFFASICVA